MDPTYAAGIGTARVRCYYDADYSDGGEPMSSGPIEAVERALELDPIESLPPDS